ncbi:CMP/dCMP deaminase, zinc-binding [Alkaliphilus metalliredigens QYMF]|uniref:tRNA-specific adenosine deaminase n=1 Tax=Alkaliphilus metalliredigens (strain QYMF) TaxID=293826 RepID=A6TJA1_ALKMQ|nr:tRNA adenosine(34) deaminase TadA [Alkaliphilus metalliredigens]ABR46269.1 CMP/dCMP deaminase, zinc-binding [Alkaliphilus metalliredigens QYMF]
MEAYYMSLALEEAKKAYELGEVPIGAIILRENKVIAAAHNLRESHHDATAHAEIIAIQAACRRLGGWRLTNSTLFVTIEPCPMCAGAILQSRIDRVVIGAMDPKAGACGSIINLLNNNQFNHQTEIVTGVLEDECSQIMKDFFKSLRQKKK